MKHEQIQFLAEFAMIALFRFLKAVEMLLQFILLPERRAVDALQCLATGIAAPVCRRHALQLDVLEPSRVRHVRTATEVSERTVGVRRNDLVGTEVVDTFEFEWVVGENLLRFVA